MHVDSSSKGILKEVGESLIEANNLPAHHYGHISTVLTKVASWAADKDDPDFNLLPAELRNYEILARINKAGSDEPNYVDQVISSINIKIEDVPLNKRWLFFLSINIEDYFNTKRYINALSDNSDLLLKTEKTYSAHVEKAYSLILYFLSDFCFPPDIVSKKNKEEIIEIFLKELEVEYKPNNLDRSNTKVIVHESKILIEYVTTSSSVFVKLSMVKGQIVIKINKAHPVMASKISKFKIYQEEEFWKTVGQALLSHTGKLELIEKFYASFGNELIESV